MKPRHGAALALVGWYLMLPPYRIDSGKSGPAYWEWEVLHHFESQYKCERARRILQVAALNGIVISFSDAPTPMIDDLPLQAEVECIAGDDPGLKPPNYIVGPPK